MNQEIIESRFWDKYWKRIALVATPIIGSISVIVAVIMWVQKASDKLDSVVTSIIEIKDDIKDVKATQKTMQIQIDTIRQTQTINKVISDMQYKHDHETQRKQ